MRQVNILFVDDEVFILHSLRRLLARSDYGKLFAGSGREALDLLAGQQIDIVITDMKMPGIDGLTLLTHIKQNYPHILRLVLSAYTQADQVLPCINRGEIFRFLTKPFDDRQFHAMIAEAIALVRWRDQEDEKVRTLRESLIHKTNNERRLEALSMTDPLTGLYNRRQLQRALAHEFHQCQRYDTDFSLLLLDLDYFKQVNDTYGHTFGDLVLQEFAGRLQKTIRDCDLACRYGGEEFVVLLPRIDLRESCILAERILLQCRTQPVRRGEISHVNTVSIGAVSYRLCQPYAPEVMLEQADRLLYVAKQNGRDQIRASFSNHLTPAV